MKRCFGKEAAWSDKLRRSSRGVVVGGISAIFTVLTLLAGGVTLVFPVPAYAQTTTAVGTIPGTFRVSPTGAALYSMPLALPPGVAGLTPQLAIEYNSQAADTYMGPGYSVSGFSQIGRCPSNIADDGALYGITFSSTDRFCLDGQRLMATSGAYGASGSIYRTEIDTFSQVQLISPTAGWVVKTKSGLTMYYGQTTSTQFLRQGNASNVIVWLLTQTVDSFGNHIDYGYNLPPGGGAGAYYPAQVSYGGNLKQGTPNDLVVTFNYKATSGFYPSGYLYGQNIIWSSLLQNIQVSVAGNPTRTWSITYSPSGTMPSLRQAPVNVQECVGSTCLNPTTFSYAPALAAANQTYGPLSAVSTNGFTGTGKFGPDGKTSIIGFSVNGSGTGTGFVWNSGLSTPYQWTASGLRAGGTVVLGDFNGDGLTDVAYITTYTTTYPTRSVDVWYSTGSAYVYGGNTVVGGGANTTIGIGSFDNALVGNFDGTGVDSILLTENICGQTTANIGSGYQVYNYMCGLKVVFPVNGTTAHQTSLEYYGITPLSQAAGNPVDSITWTVGDFNGDGIDDAVLTAYDPFLWISSSNSTLYLSGNGATSGLLNCNCVAVSHAPQFQNGVATGTFAEFHADLNNDGLSDAMFYYQGTGSSSFELDYAFNNGSDPSYSEFSHPTAMSVTLPTSNRYVPIVTDLNGDGYADIVLVEMGTTLVHIVPVLSTGSGFAAEAALTVSAPSNPASFLTGDTYGNGLNDVLLVAGSSVVTAGVGGALHRRVSGITDGLGATIAVGYASLSSNIYSDSATVLLHGGTTAPVAYPTRYLAAPEYLVATTSTSNAGANPNLIQTGYSYANARQDQQGRGFLGFSSVQAANVNTTLIAQNTSYAQDFPYTGSVYANQTSYNNAGRNLTISQTINTLALQNPVGGAPYFPYTQASQHTNYEIDSNSSVAFATVNTSGVAYNNYGDLTNKTVTTTDLAGNITYTQVTANQYSDDTTNWFLDRLSDTQVTFSDSTGNPSITRESSFQYDPVTGVLTQEKVEPNDSAHWLETDYVPDGFGNIATVKMSGADIPSRSKQDIFSTSSPYYGRFKTANCNFAGPCSTLTFDEATGDTLTETDPNGLTASHTPDAFGRDVGGSFNQAGLSLSIGISRKYCSSMSPSWCDSANNPAALYGVETTGSDGSDSIAIYDANERLVGNRTLLGSGVWSEKIVEYDTAGRQSQVSSPFISGNTPKYWTTTQYDYVNRPNLIVGPTDANDPQVTLAQYSHNGLSTIVTDALGLQTTKTLTAMGDLASVTDANNKVMTYGYDAVGNLTSTVDAASPSHKTSMVYDILGHKTSMTDATLGTWSYTPDVLGETVSQRDANQKTIGFTYDVLGRPKTRVAPDYSYAWTWDQTSSCHWVGALCDAQKTATNSGAVVYDRSYGYNGFGALNSDTQTIGSTPYTMQYGYSDGQGRLTDIIYPTGFHAVVGYTNGAESSITQAGTGGMTFWSAQAWDAWEQVSQEQLGNGVVGNIARDPAVGTVQSLTSGLGGNSTVANLSYAWDGDGNIQNRRNYNDSPPQESFAYDNVNRLKTYSTQYNRAILSDILTPDVMGNVQSQYNAPYFYGNRSYAWTAENQLAQASDNYLGQVSFQYGTDGDVVAQTDSSPNGGATTTAYLADGLAENINTGSGTTWNYYLPAPTGSTAMVVQSPTQSDAVQFLQRDNLGSIVAVTDSSGNVVQRYTYGIEGDRGVSYAAPGYNGMLTDLGFTGHLQIDSLNLVHMQGRVYDPTQGRFLSADPFVPDSDNMQSFNRYSYTYDNPSTFVDPSGFDAICVTVTIGDESFSDDSCSGGGLPTLTPPVTPPAPPPQTPDVYALGGFLLGLAPQPGNLPNPVMAQPNGPSANPQGTLGVVPGGILKSGVTADGGDQPAASLPPASLQTPLSLGKLGNGAAGALNKWLSAPVPEYDQDTGEQVGVTTNGVKIRNLLLPALGTLGLAGGEVVAGAFGESSASLVARTAQQAIADRGGVAGLTRLLTPKQLAAAARYPNLMRAYLGSLIHRETFLALQQQFGSRFIYSGVGPDFYDTVLAQYVELTTADSLAAHVARYALSGLGIDYAIYDLP